MSGTAEEQEKKVVVDNTKGEEHGDDDEKAPEEEAAVEFKPLVSLKEVEVVTHEEDEETLFKMYVKNALFYPSPR